MESNAMLGENHEDSSINLWQTLLRECSIRSPTPSCQVLLCGSSDAGKDCLTKAMFDLNNVVNEANLEEKEQISALPARFNHALLPSEDDPSCEFNVWSISEPNEEVVNIVLKPELFNETVIMIALDVSTPWNVKVQLEKWIELLEKTLKEKMKGLDLTTRGKYYATTQRQWTSYVEPNSSSSAVKTDIRDTSNDIILPEGVLTRNLGIPIIFVLCKTDTVSIDDAVKLDYLQYCLRKLSLQYGATLCYTSAKSGSNIRLLRDYIMHRGHSETFKCTDPPNLVDRELIFVPSGYDSNDLIEQSLVGSQPRWPSDASYDKIIPTLVDKKADQNAMNPEVKVDDHQTWLRKLEKAAGSGLDDLQKRSIEASRKQDESLAARRAEAEGRKLEIQETKKDIKVDVNPKNLTNFFNNLLSRPEKAKSSRHDKTKAKDKKDVKDLAEAELHNMSQRL